MDYDLIIIGSGPGGYLMAEQAGHAGKKVLLIEKDNLGGVCLNWGCIPTKSLLNSSKHYLSAKNSAQLGVCVEQATFNLHSAMEWKESVIRSLRQGIETMLRKSKVTILKGSAYIHSTNSVKVGDEEYQAKDIVIATGSSPMIPPIPGVKLNRVMTSNEILNISQLPKSLAVVGGGVIGIEFASLFATLGVKVEVIELLDEILPLMDSAQASEFRTILQKDITFNLGSKVTAIDETSLYYRDKNGAEKSCDAELILIAVGRSPNVSDLGLENLRIDFDHKGIKTDEQQRTNIPNVYAIGDVTGKSQLAHCATRMGEVALNTILGAKDRFRMNAIPWAVYSIPEIAGCGVTEAQAVKDGRSVKTAVLPLTRSGRFVAEHGVTTRGSLKIVADAQTDVILGVHIYGHGVSELIYGAAIMIESELRTKDLKEVIFPHPTVGEVMRDAMFLF